MRRARKALQLMLASQAEADTPQGASARAALAALSVVSVDVSTVVAAQFSLYDEATGAGNITQQRMNNVGANAPANDGSFRCVA